MSLYLKGLQSCRPSKFAIKKIKLKFWVRGYNFAILCSNFRGPGSIPGRGGLWGAAALQPLKLRRRIVPHWKALTLRILGLEAQGGGSTFRVHHAL